MLFTTYLANLREGFPDVEKMLQNRGLKEPKVYYVMRNRGNNEVAPTEEMLGLHKKGNWPVYQQQYRERIKSVGAKNWIDRVAEEALWQDVVLVCFEKDHNRCHRTLLAIEIIRKHPEVNYVGELLLSSLARYVR